MLWLLFERLHRHITMTPDSFLYSCKCYTSVNSSFSSPSFVTACYIVRYGMAMIGGFVVASIFVQQWLKSPLFQTARLCCLVNVWVSDFLMIPRKKYFDNHMPKSDSYAVGNSDRKLPISGREQNDQFLTQPDNADFELRFSGQGILGRESGQLTQPDIPTRNCLVLQDRKYTHTKRKPYTQHQATHSAAVCLCTKLYAWLSGSDHRQAFSIGVR